MAYRTAQEHHQCGRFTEAEAGYREVLRLWPGLPEPLHYLGILAHQRGQSAEALALLAEALRLAPRAPLFHNNLGVILRELGRFEEAIAEHECALALRPDFADAQTCLAVTHWTYACALLGRGDYGRGWKEYEWRMHPAIPGGPERHFGKPLWNGMAAPGATILLHAEQGLGDAIQFVRFVPRVAARVGRIIVACVEPLRRLFSQMSGVAQVYGPGEPLPHFDLECPFGSLPLRFGVTAAELPATVPYLAVPAELMARWAELVALPPSRQPKIGLCWRGSVTNAIDTGRSYSLKDFAPLYAEASGHYYSLQIDASAEEIRETPLINLTPEIRDLADTAALVSQLDLVITVDTAVAHVAGALGIPVWVVLSPESDWRWLHDRTDSPWYPSARLFRRAAEESKGSVMQRVAQALPAAGVDR